MPVIKQCQHCGEEYPVKPHRLAVSKFCSRDCADAFGRVDKICNQCGRTYPVKRSHAEGTRFCTRACKGAWRSVHMAGANAPNYRGGAYVEYTQAICRVCAEPFEQLRAHLEKGYGDICSKACRAKNFSTRFSGANSPHARPKLRVVCDWCGVEKRVTPSTAKHFRFCSKDCRNDWQSKELMRGENHPNWQGGKTDARALMMASREYKAWRKAVFERDCYTCQSCGDKRGGNLHAHHIKFYSTHPELAFELDNGLTLCNDCHTELHRHAKAA